jgi:hypothetical protein
VVSPRTPLTFDTLLNRTVEFLVHIYFPLNSRPSALVPIELVIHWPCVRVRGCVHVRVHVRIHAFVNVPVRVYARCHVSESMPMSVSMSTE